ncbi:hypothetical protein G9A89_002282 [Geosiphon pyriformis]|nr:hypothetical protein G9A89_002282 [Geosiphon pyriformis]
MATCQRLYTFSHLLITYFLFVLSILVVLNCAELEPASAKSPGTEQSQFARFEQLLAGDGSAPFLFEETNLDAIEDSKALRQWGENLAKAAVKGKVQHILKNHPPPSVAKSVVNHILGNPGKRTRHRTPSPPSKSFRAASNTMTEKKTDILKALLLLDSIYDSVSEIPYFRTEEAFEPNAPRSPAVEVIVTSLVIRGKQTFDNFIDATSSTTGTACSSTNKTYHNQSDRSIFYNSLSAGLSSGILTRLSKNSNIDFKTNILIDVMSTLAIQIHMVKSIASLAGLDTDDDAVRTMIYLCIASDSVKSLMAQAARDLAIISMRRMVGKIPSSALAAINKRVAMKLITKGKIGLVSLASLVPLIGDLIIFIADGMSTYGIGKVAKFVFCPLPTVPPSEDQGSSSSSSPPSPSSSVSVSLKPEL